MLVRLGSFLYELKRCLKIRVDLNDTYNIYGISLFPEILAFHQTQRGLNRVELVPQLALEIIVHPAQNRLYSSCASGTHGCGGPTVIALTRRQVSVPLGVKSITNSSRKDAQRFPKAKKSQLMPSPSSVGRPPRCVHLANSATRSQKAIAPSAFGHDYRMTLRTTPVSFVRSQVVAQLKRWGCPILCGLVYKFPEKP